MDDPVAIKDLEVSALEWRRHQAALMAHDTDTLSARPGTLHGLSVTVAGLTATVAPGAAAISPTSGANGTYVAVNAASLGLTISAQHATYSRIDRVIARIYDNEADGSGQSKSDLQIITGTAAASPVAPTLPSGTEEIAQLSVGSAGNPIVVVDKRRWAASAGGVLTVASYSTLPLSNPALRKGQLAWTTDYNVLWAWTGTRWAPCGTPNVISTTIRDAAIPSPAVGDTCTAGTGTTLRAYIHDGTSWRQVVHAPDATYTPTLTNGTMGSTGTATGSTTYLSPDLVRVDFVVNFGTGGDVTGTLLLNIPVSLGLAQAGQAYARRGNGVPIPLLCYTASSTALAFVTTSGNAIVNQTVPHDWTNGDTLAGFIIAKVAS